MSMDKPETPTHLPAFISKMKHEKLDPIVIDTFVHYYQRVVEGATGYVFDKDIEPVAQNEIEDAARLAQYADAGTSAFNNTIVIVLNGGLGTSMGLTGPKSLLEVKKGRSFLEIILKRAARQQVKLALMNSFSTHADTLSALARIKPAISPRLFLQNKFPKILRRGLAPAEWPPNRALEWNPPGHGDIYTAMKSSGLLDELLQEDVRYAFICNSDNLGASLEAPILGYFVKNRFPFMMEVAQRTPSDSKGGHLARHKDGYLLLREAAQCPDNEKNAFSDIRRYSFFNTNNIWIDLQALKDQIERRGKVHLPLILNSKTLDPRDKKSPPVFQVETAMGAAISLFEKAVALKVPRKRFFPVKKCNDLLVVRSDYFIMSHDHQLALNPARRSDSLKIRLDPEFFGKIDFFNDRFAKGVPSLVDCESLTIKGDVFFKKNVTIKGRVTIENKRGRPAVIEEGRLIEGNLGL